MGENNIITDDEMLRNCIYMAFSAIELDEEYDITGSEVFGWIVVVKDIGTWEIAPSGLVIESK